ncbi:MAG: PilZ domain-containing protein [Bdellovibrio bacteriovorus]
MEHRLDRRVPLKVPVRLRFQDGTAGFGMALNISRGGIYVKTAAPWRSGCIDVRMTVSTASGERTALLPGLIVHGGAEGIGLMFRQLDQRSEALVSWLVSGEGWPERQPEIAAAPRLIATHFPAWGGSGRHDSLSHT